MFVKGGIFTEHILYPYPHSLLQSTATVCRILNCAYDDVICPERSRGTSPNKHSDKQILFQTIVNREREMIIVLCTRSSRPLQRFSCAIPGHRQRKQPWSSPSLLCNDS